MGALGLAAPAAEAAAPPNDDFEGATVLTPPTLRQDSDVAMDFTGATLQANEPDHGGVGAPGTLWYVFTAPRDQRVVVLVGGAVRVAAVYTGDRLDALKPVAQVTHPGDIRTVRVTWQAVKQTTYRIAVGVNPAWPGRPDLHGDIRLMDATLPRNDDFADAQPLRVTRRPRTYGGNIDYATSEPGEPPIFYYGRQRAERTVWFRFRVRRELGITISTKNPDTLSYGCSFRNFSVYVGTRLRTLRRANAQLDGDPDRPP